MTTLLWILVSTGAMSIISLVGLVFLALQEEFLQKAIPFLVAFSAGSLMGGSFLHLLPHSLEHTDEPMILFVLFLIGFSMFLFLEQFLNWHHTHGTEPAHKHDLDLKKEPVTYLILLADTLHNFIGGLAIGSSFLIDVRVGWITWLAAAAHEIPQEFGDFGILVKGGWSKWKALLLNFASALTIIPGGVLVYYFASEIQPVYLLPLAAGNFTYIAASDLIPEIKHSERLTTGVIHFIVFVFGIGMILAVRLLG